jgi:hypothetical protein
MLQRLIVLAAWVSIAALAFLTLTHVGFVYSIYFRLAPYLHAKMTTYAHFEHLILERSCRIGLAFGERRCLLALNASAPGFSGTTYENPDCGAQAVSGLPASPIPCPIKNSIRCQPVRRDE